VCVLLVVLVTSVLVRTTTAQLRGDVNCDGKVAADDLTALPATIFNDVPSDCPEGDLNPDVNADERIGSADLTALVDVLVHGPVVTFFGLANAEGYLLDLNQRHGPPVYSILNGFQFLIVVEGAPGFDGARVGPCAYGVYDLASDSCMPSCAPDCTSLPDLQIEASNPLGNGSPAVCDRRGLSSNPGGIPGVATVTFDPTTNPNIIDIVNDLACRFVDGGGAPIGRPSGYACVKYFPSEESGYANPQSTMEFCALITSDEQFPPAADTALTVRLRDVDGNVGAPAQIIVHAGP
jgi:hypothetical protein